MTKYGKDLVVGDVLIAWDGRSRTITHFSSHPGLGQHTARIAHSGDWAVTVFDSEICSVAEMRP